MRMSDWSSDVCSSDLVHRGKTPATTDNALYVPPRMTVNLDARYLFKLDGKDALFRVQIVNLFDEQGFSIAGPGIYAANAGRYQIGRASCRGSVCHYV